MAEKHYRVIAPNGEKVRLDHHGKIYQFVHGEIVKLEESIAKAFSGIFYEIKIEGVNNQPDDISSKPEPQESVQEVLDKDNKKEVKKESKKKNNKKE